MLNSNACEDIIANCQQFAKELANLKQVYAGLPQVIESEHNAIRERNLPVMEELVKEKLQIGQALEEKMNKAMDCIISVRSICEQNLVEVPEFQVQLSLAIEFFKTLVPHFESSDEFKAKVFGKVIVDMETGLTDFLEAFERTKGRIAVNKRLTTELLKHQQDSIRFWQEVAMESEATYNASGLKKNDQNAGVLKVEA